MRFILAIAMLLAIVGQPGAQQQSGFRTGQPIAQLTPTLPLTWTLEEVTDGSVPDEVVADNRESPRNGLPDGKIAVPETETDIAEAWYAETTTRYRHAVLGDGIEAGALKVKTPRGETYTFRLPRTEVFEDITPRLADLDNDGTTEVITIVSSRFEGASVAVFGLVGNAFIKKAQSPFIGRPNRWLNIAGIGTFTGRNVMEIAVVETPHLSGRFKLYFFSPNKAVLKTPGQTPGFSNHELGSRELRLSATADIDGDRLSDLVLPSLDRRTLYLISLARGAIKLLGRIDLPAAVNRAISVRRENGAVKIVTGLDDGNIYSITGR